MTFLEKMQNYSPEHKENWRQAQMDKSLLKANFTPAAQVKADEPQPDPQAEYRKKAIESIGGSMVFVERSTLFWDGHE